MKHELLAPAGNIEAGYAALHYGADAVYLGLTKFSARAGAENFTADELDEFTAYAHSLNRKVFVALNTILTEAEVEELKETFDAIRKARVDALIIQDLGVFYLAKRMLPEVELHASTQMAVHNAEGAKFLQSVGFKRVVLARELSLAEIKAIAEACPNLDLEVFVHGALCYSYSGQCLFSALEYGKSANRGRCIYPCRSLFERKSVLNNGQIAVRKPHVVASCTSMYTRTPWRAHDDSTIIYPTFSTQKRGDNVCGEEQISHFSTSNVDEVGGESVRSHLFSMKDLALEEAVLSIPALSLKIEGRKKSPLYVAAVTNYYRHILDGKKKDLNEAEDIKQIFSRPWCRFFFNGKNKEVTDVHFVGHRGLLIGKVEKVGKGKLGFKTAHTIARYDGVQIDSGNDEKPFGFGVKALFVNNKPVFEATAGQYVELELPEVRPHLAVGAPVYLASSSAVKGKYDYVKPKAGAFRNLESLDVIVEIGADSVWAFSGDAAVSVAGCFEAAKDAAKVEAAVRTAFAKTGGTAFEVRSLDVRNPRGLFVPVSMLNELRRLLIEKVRESQGDILSPSPYTLSPQGRGELASVASQDIFACSNPKALKVVDVALEMEVSAVSEVADVWFRLPQICRNMGKLSMIVKALYEKGARKFLAENYYVFELLKPYCDVQIGAGSFLYVMNSYAAAALHEFGAAFATLALESAPENMRAVAEHAVLPLAQVVKAYPPLFTSAVCIRPNACKDCTRGEKRYRLKKDGKEYTAVSKDCQIQLFANVPYERAAVFGVSYVISEEDSEKF